jgi:hypothetical protein
VNETFNMRMRCLSRASDKTVRDRGQRLGTKRFSNAPNGLETLPAGCHIL